MAVGGGEAVNLMRRPPFIPSKIPGLICVRGRAEPRAIVLLEGLGQLKNSMTSSGIKPVTFRRSAKLLHINRSCNKVWNKCVKVGSSLYRYWEKRWSKFELITIWSYTEPKPTKLNPPDKPLRSYQPYSPLKAIRRFCGTYRLLLQGKRISRARNQCSTCY
jgi:hypothetical protein